MKKQRFTCGILAFVMFCLDLWAYYGSSGWLKHWMATYGHDVLLPMFLYFFNRAIWHRNLNRPLVIVIYVFMGATAFEFAQLGHLYSGTFDPLDIIAYLVGVTGALGIDVIATRSKAHADGKTQSA